jgi:hypothetical protein
MKNTKYAIYQQDIRAIIKCAGTGGQSGCDAFKATSVPALNVETHLLPIEYIIRSITPSPWKGLVSGDNTIG